MSIRSVIRTLRKASSIIVMLCFSSVVAQDGTCSVFVENALAVVSDECAGVGRNQACYGNNTLQAIAREGVQQFNFQERGDLANVADIDSMRLRQLDQQEEVWGIALMKIQANLPDSLPGQNVTFLLFGDVEIQNAVPSAADIATLAVTTSSNINVRRAPSTNGAILGSLGGGETVVANGRNEEGTWVRVQLSDADSLGWVFAQLVTTEGDLSSLNVVSADDLETPLSPMQAFYFSSGVTGTNCTEAPQNGMLIQTPQGTAAITLRANDVAVTLGSSAFFQAEAGMGMTVSVIEGQAEITAEGETVVVPAGARVYVPEGEAPGTVEPYDAEALQTLPIQLLPEVIEIAAPLTAEEIVSAEDNSSGFGGMIPGGFDASLYSGMDSAIFCPIMAQSVAESGISMSDFLAQIQSITAFVPAEGQADFSAFIAMLQQCN